MSKKVAVVSTCFSDLARRYMCTYISIFALTQVTGSNRGIGFAIVRGLCEQFDGDVYLTARDESRGLAAVKKLNDVSRSSHN